MLDFAVLLWVACIFFAAVFFSSISTLQLIQNRELSLDKGSLYPLSACLLALLLSLSIWPPLHRVYDDEPTFISQSFNILLSGKAGITTKGTLLRPEATVPWTVNPKLPGFAWMEAVVLFFTHDYQQGYFILNIILGVLSVGAAYRIAWLLTASHAAAWWTAVFLACLPVRITYAMSASSDIAGLSFFLLFLLFLCEYRGARSRKVLYAALFCGIYSVCIKQFCAVLVFSGFAVALYIYRRDGLLDKKLFSQVLRDSFFLSLPILASTPVFFGSDLKAGGYSFLFVYKNLCTSLHYLFNYEQSTLLTSLAATAAMLRSVFYKRDALAMGALVWLLTGLLMMSVFYAGGIYYPGRAYSDRYFLLLSFPFVFLAARAVVDIIQGAWSRLWRALFFIILVLNAFYASNHLTREARDGFYAKKTSLLRQVSVVVPQEAYILNGTPGMVSMISSRRSILLELFLDGDHPEKVVFLKGVPDDLYDPDDPQRMLAVENILKARYRCDPLVSAPFKEADLSAVPLLCDRD